MIKMRPGKGHLPCTEAFRLPTGDPMKKKPAILLIALLLGTGLFAAATEKGTAKIHVSSLVAEFSLFGVSSTRLLPVAYTSIANFSDAVSASIDSTVVMTDLGSDTPVGYVAALNNTKKPLNIYLAASPLTNGTDRVLIHVTPTHFNIPKAAESKFGILESSTIYLREKTPGAALRAPAGEYTSTIRITVTFGG